MKDATEKTANYSFGQKICYILSNGSYMATVVTLTGLFLVISGVQYWITDYIQTVLGHSKETAFIIYILVGAAGPILGVAFSGCVFDRIGGYHGRNTPVLFTILLMTASVFGILSAFFDELVWVAACLLAQLLSGGLTVPVLTGYMLSQVP